MTTTVDTLRPKALAVLRSGRCSVVRAVSDEQWHPTRVMAIVKSSRPGSGQYVVEMSHGRWECTCRAGLMGEPCPHAAAVQLVTEGERA